ncbi:MAG: BPTI/Kunitz domain-containing protein [Flavobacteriales bacterium]|nr:BPTI/Kunitz domain-containing protein [Flavobacteriales bacterium]
MKRSGILLSSSALLFIISTAHFCNKPGEQDERCKLLPDPGPCEAYIPRYYYDQKTGACRKFFWGGCNGVVPFETEEECKKACGCD